MQILSKSRLATLMPGRGKYPFCFKSKEEMQYFFLSRTRKAATAFQIIDKENLVDTGIKSSNRTYQFYFHALLSRNWRRQKHNLHCRKIPLALQVIWVKAIGSIWSPQQESSQPSTSTRGYLSLLITQWCGTIGIGPLHLNFPDL